MMDDAVRRALLEILRIGLLRVRAAGYAGRAKECALEADHLHNLPRVIQTLAAKELLYYYSVERPSFAKQSTSDVKDLEPLWEELGTLLREPAE
jgi:hypothetical protein